jgi:hypothetical protein
MFVCEITLSLFPNLLKKVWNDSVPNSGKKTESFGVFLVIHVRKESQLRGSTTRLM